jgi:hypothetical protein
LATFAGLKAILYLIEKMRAAYTYKYLSIVVAAIVMALSSTGCGEEPDFCEADIETVTLHVASPGDFFFQTTDSMQTVYSTDSIITFSVRSHADVSALAPEFTLSSGATVSPASGTTQDFSNGPVIYTVTSQDGKWHRRYRVNVVPTVISVADTLRRSWWM